MKKIGEDYAHVAPLKKAGDGPLRIALVGQPNCGKSTLFNAVAGFKVNTGNFAGTTVSYTETLVATHGTKISLIDLPGSYSITSQDLAEKVTRDYLLAGSVDVVINVIDASMLSRSLELTLQLMEMDLPLIVALNMMDEAQRKGVQIELNEFQRLTGITAWPIVAVQGKGVDALFGDALAFSREQFRPKKPIYDRDVEQCLARIAGAYPPSLRELIPLPPRFVAIRLLDLDGDFERKVDNIDPLFLSVVQRQRKQLADLHDWPENGVFASHRHGLVLDLYEKIARHEHSRKLALREKMDKMITNPLIGGFVVLASLFAMFYTSFSLGEILSGFLDAPFNHLHKAVDAIGSIGVKALASGLLDGVQAGAGIVLPYLVPLLFLLAIYEDTGLLPRIAFMVDGILHRVGMHGKSIVPIILGFGCNVPAIMSTRNLEAGKDRRLAMLVVPFVACSARTVIILGLVGRYLGPLAATLVYVGNIAITLLVSYVLSRFNVHLSSGMVMEVPPLRRPYANIIFKKVWLNLYDFFVRAWPVILISSVALALASLIGLDSYFNRAFYPLTKVVMKLPESVGITLFLGIFRKELALIMLATALGTSDVGSILTHHQLITLTVFTVLYIPCVATLSTLRAEGGWKLVGQSALLNFSVAIVIAGIVAWL